MSYSPVLGRFIQRDPLGYVDGANVYQYVASDPLGLTDPRGEVHGDKSPQEYDDHMRKLKDAQRALDELRKRHAKASGKKLQECLKQAIEFAEKEIKGHVKEIRQKWPNGRPGGYFPIPLLPLIITPIQIMIDSMCPPLVPQGPCDQIA